MIKPKPKQIKAWYEMLADYGCVVTQDSQVHIHHCVGRSYVKDKVKIGELFMLPLWIPLHDVHSNHEFNVTHHQKAFVNEYGMERDLFAHMVEIMRSRGQEIPFDQIYLDKIAEVYK